MGWVCEKEPEGVITKEQEKTFGGAGYGHYIDCGDVSQMYTYVCQVYQIVLFKYVKFLMS